VKSVCILVQNQYEPDIRVRRKAEALVAAGYTVDVLALRSAYSKSKTYTLGGVNVHTVSLGKKRGSLARYAFEYGAFFVWAFFKLLFLMGRRRYAVVDVNNLPDFLVFAAAYAKWKGAKVVFDMHEITPEFYISKYGIAESSWVTRFLKWIERASFNFADQVITINEPITKLLRSRGLPASKATEIMNSVDGTLFAGALAEPATGDSAKKPEKFVMMYHGTLTRIYGLDIAIEAFGSVQQQMPNAEFWILGGGPEKASLEALSRKLGLGGKVQFIGSVLPREVHQWLSRCDIGVLATRRDIFLDYSFSNKLSEYIIMGKGVISSRLKAIQHYFSGDALAYFEPGNPTDLARQMVLLYSDHQLRSRLAEEARREYDPIRWEVMKQRYLSLMGALVGVEAGVGPVSVTAASRETVSWPPCRRNSFAEMATERMSQPAIIPAQATRTALALLNYCRASDWAGYDPYDALNSRLLAFLPILNFRVPRIALTQILKRSPINLRGLLLVSRTQNPNGIVSRGFYQAFKSRASR
jgi:glycosyltransferase involved in cell wall biosynthesis